MNNNLSSGLMAPPPPQSNKPPQMLNLQSQIANHSLNSNGGPPNSGIPNHMQMAPGGHMQGSIYDQMGYPNVNMNGMGVPKQPGDQQQQQQQQLVYLGGHGPQPHLSVLPQQNQYFPRNVTQVSCI